MNPTPSKIRLVTALLCLNGLTLQQIEALQPDQIDLDDNWIRLLGANIPLVEQVGAAVQQMQEEGSAWYTPEEIPAILKIAGLDERRAHRQLAGALWITSEDTRLISSVGGLSEAPILPLSFTFPFSVVERLDPDLPVDLTQESRTALQAAADWLEKELLAPKLSIRARIIGALLEGKTVFLLANTGANGINLLYNLVMGRLLTPAEYSQLALVITLHLLVGLLPSAWQTAAARYSAAYAARDDLAAVHRIKSYGRRLTTLIGISVMILSFLAMPLLANLFQLDSPSLLVPLIVAMPFFIALAADRGILQGVNGFYWLAVIYLSESVTRLGIGVILVLLLMAAGTALEGAIWGVGQSMVITWFFGWLALNHLRASGASAQDTTPPEARIAERREWLKLTSLSLTALIGQALITNSDFLLVKSLFPPSDSGLYAAVSVLGRIAYFGTIPLTVVMVPMFARKQALDQPTRPYFFLMLGGGALFCLALIGAAVFFSNPILNILYGDAYAGAAAFLPVYTVAASLYVIVNLVVTYRVALGKGSETILPLGAGVAQVIGILLFHETIQQVILVQIVLMAVLLALVLWRGLRTES